MSGDAWQLTPGATRTTPGLGHRGAAYRSRCVPVTTWGTAWRAQDFAAKATRARPHARSPIPVLCKLGTWAHRTPQP